jgi:serine phosphatase RsbU (regulator of sigma subunit)
VAPSASPKKHLKLYTEQPSKPIRPPAKAIACLPDLLRAFQAATGWVLRYSQNAKPNEFGKSAWVTPAGESARPTGALVLDPEKNTGSASENPPGACAALHCSRAAAQSLAGSIADMLGELLQTRHALCQREAELAAGVPLVPHREEEKHLAARLEAVLRAGVEAVGCDAAGLYMLDEATTTLKLRSAWGLPFDRLAAPARPLRGAMADLEAMLGHAVVLNDDVLMQTWTTPEDFPAAVCVPVSTPTTLLGTLWIFSNERRDFNSRETNIIEVIAGRLAADLEREMLLRVGVDGAKLQKQVAAAERLQRNELPTIAPMLDGWDVAGWTDQADGVGGAFHDWFCLPNGLLAVAVGQADQRGLAGAMIANAAKIALRSHARYHREVERVLQQANLTLWTGSAGDRRVSLFHSLIETATGRVNCASAGKSLAVVLHDGGWHSLSRTSGQLGEGPETDFEPFDYQLQPGDAMLLFTGGEGGMLSETVLADALNGKSDRTAEELLALARSTLEAHRTGHDRRDCSILVVKRTRD